MADVEQMIGAGFAGISTCTHLNDTLRGLAELPDLVALLEFS
jgi:NADH dehydrogenase FAD-containing subunit